MKTKYIRLLLVLGLALAALSWIPAHDKSEWAFTILMSLGTGLVTAGAVVWCYEVIEDSRLEKERKEREVRVVKALAVVVRQHYRVLLDCYRSAYDGNETPNFRDVNEFLGPQYQPVTQWLDLYAKSPANSVAFVPFYAYVESGFKQMHAVIQSTLHSVSADYLEQELYLAMRRLIDAPFMSLCQSLVAIFTNPHIPFKVPSQLVMGSKVHMEEYCLAFCHLINAMERCVLQGLREYRIDDWHNTIFKIGHARLADAEAARSFVIPPENVTRTGFSFTPPPGFFGQSPTTP